MYLKEHLHMNWVPGSWAPQQLKLREYFDCSILPACREVRFSEVMSVQSSRSRNTTQLVCWTGRLWGLTCCNTVCPRTRWPHTITHSHTQPPATQAYDQHAPGWHKQTQMVAVLARDQTWTCRHTHKNPSYKWTDIPAHILRNTHTQSPEPNIETITLECHTAFF